MIKFRLSILLAAVATFLAFGIVPDANSASNSSSKNRGVIGMLKLKPGCRPFVKHEGEKEFHQVTNGYEVEYGDIIKTSATYIAQVSFTDGGLFTINKSSTVRIYLQGRTVVASILIGGGNYFPPARPGPNDIPVIVQQGDSDVSESPYLGAFSFGNFAGNSGGGGGGNSNGPTTTRVLATGQIGIFNSAGQQIGVQ